MIDNVAKCRVCGSASLTKIPGYDKFTRVTSDCKPWTAGGTLFVCDDCGVAQKCVDAKWKAEVQEIYDSYTIYHQSRGQEQAVFGGGNGGAARSSVLVRKLVEHFSLPSKGRLLDIGCGNGSLLRSFSSLRPEWSFCGTELNSNYVESVESIEQVEGVYCGSPEIVPGDFDVITMVHVLEHIPDPDGFLRIVRSKLNKNGILVIQIPDYQLNPFDLFIADHSIHFTAYTLERYLISCGFTIDLLDNNWIPKETTVVVKMAADVSTVYSEKCLTPSTAITDIAVCMEWLAKVICQAKELSKMGSFGIFGTSIAATWLASELGTGIDFFVDEDKNRIGKLFMGRTVLHPEQVSDGSSVFISLPSTVAMNIYERLSKSHPGLAVYMPPHIYFGSHDKD